MSQKLISSRLRLYGKPASKEEIAQEVARLLIGNSKRNVKPISITAVSKALGFERMTIYRYRDLAIDLKLITVDKDGNPQLPKISQEESFETFSENHPILSNYLVAEWWKNLQTRNQGTAITAARRRINLFQTILNYLRVNPEQFLVSHSQTEKLITNFLSAWNEGKVSNRKKKAAPDVIQYQTACTIGDFCGFHHMTWQKGVSGVMSRKVVRHGKYADVKLTNEEIQKGASFIIKNYGLDSDLFRWWSIGIETCARFGALYGMENNYTKHESPNGKITYYMKVFESKTKKIKDGIWKKWITGKDTQKSIDLIKKRGNKKIIDDSTSRTEAENYFNTELRKVYEHLGKDGFYLEKPTHAMRHIGAQKLLLDLDWNTSLVSQIGGWNTADELEKSYGEMPQEIITMKMDELLEK